MKINNHDRNYKISTKIDPKMTVSGTFTIGQLEVLIKAKHDYESLLSLFDSEIPDELLPSPQIRDLDAAKLDLKLKYQRFIVLCTPLNQKED